MRRLFTEAARKTIFFAEEEAQSLGSSYVSTEHFLLGLIRNPEARAFEVLSDFGVDISDLRQSILSQLPEKKTELSALVLTPRAKRVIDLTYSESRDIGSNFIGTEHLLLGLIREEDGLAGRVLQKVGLDLDEVRNKVIEIQSKNPGAEDDVARVQTAPTSPEQLLLSIAEDSSTIAGRVLNRFGLTPETLLLEFELEESLSTDSEEPA